MQPFGRFGLGYMRVQFDHEFDSFFDDTQGDFAISMGGGVDYYFTEKLFVQLDLGGIIPPGDDLDGLNQFTFGLSLQARF